MSQNLMVVESAAKSKTIAKYLGKDFKVLASVGHVRDLPIKTLGVDVEHDFKLEYVVNEDKKKVIVDNHGEQKYLDMLRSLDDPDKLQLTQDMVLPNFLNQALDAFQEA